MTVSPNFSIAEPLVGGALIGVAAALMLLFTGRVAGVSGIFGSLLTPRAGDTLWRVAFVAGLVAGGVALFVGLPSAYPSAPTRPLLITAIAGLLVGFGTRMGSGCTSGHGVCGMSRMSVRSLVATLTFIATGALAVLVFGAMES